MGLLKIGKALLTGLKAIETRTGLDTGQLLTLAGGLGGAYSAIHNKNLDPRDRRKEALTSVGMAALTFNHKHPTVMGMALNLGMHLPGMARSMVGSYRSALEARSMVAIPFSHSSAPMDIAYQSMQYGMSRVNDARGNQGSEAAMYASKYISGKYISKSSVY